MANNDHFGIDDNLDDIDYGGAVGGEDTERHRQMSTLDSPFLVFDYTFDLQKLKIFARETGDVNISLCQEYEPGDVDIHQPLAGQWEPNPQTLDPQEAEIISIGDYKNRVPPRDGRGPPWERIIDPKQEQGEVPPDFDTTHAIVPSGSYYGVANMILMPVFTSRYSSESRSVTASGEHSVVGDNAYCFSNSFVYMSSLSGSTAVPVLQDLAPMFTESFANSVASEYDDVDDGVDSDVDI